MAPRVRYLVQVGQRFGRLVVVAQERGPRRQYFHCRCDCGELSSIYKYSLLKGSTTSCGCVSRSRMIRHGLSSRPEYRIWVGMWQRCRNPKHREYDLYGGRGITVCDRWRDFRLFWHDLGPRPSAKHSLHRRDSDGPYAPDNVHWATAREQSRQTRRNRYVTFGGDTLTVTDWAYRQGLNPGTVFGRIHRHGWTPEEALELVERG